MEKTFEELIEEKVKLENWFIPTDVGKKFMVELMQQVREATITEIAILYIPDGNPESWLNKINDLPTDRITITDND